MNFQSVVQKKAFLHEIFVTDHVLVTDLSYHNLYYNFSDDQIYDLYQQMFGEEKTMVFYNDTF